MSKPRGPYNNLCSNKKKSKTKVEYIEKKKKGVWRYIKPDGEYAIKTMQESADKKMGKIGLSREEVIEYLRKKKMKHAVE
ncbi:MAG: hypothetical protein ACTSYW_00605 [Candidatus Heimdallarchaeota archaeon]